jgi:hypothetical protein
VFIPASRKKPQSNEQMIAELSKLFGPPQGS